MGKSAKKSSLAVKIAAMCVAITMATALTLSAVFIANTRGITQQQATTGTVESIHALRDQLVARFGDWEALVRFTAVGASSLIAAYEGVNAQALQDLFASNVEIQPDVNILYGTSNALWNGPGGFAVFHNSWIPPAGWDNTERPWFLAAKANPGLGRVGYTAPFVDAMTGNLIISVVTNIYDNFGNDLGVISTDVGLAFMNDLLDEKIIMPGHEIFLINRQGYFITHHDQTAVLANDFFSDFGIARYRNDVLGRSSFMSHGRDVFIYSELIPGVDWILVSVIPISAIFAEINQLIFRMVLLGIALSVAAAIVSILFTYKALTIPIRSIKSGAGSLANMDFSVDIKKTETDEIGDIQEAMITVRDNLKKSIDNMKNAHLDDMRIQQERESVFKERMNAILDSSPLVCALYDENANVLDVNKEAENIFGIPNKQVFINSFKRFLPKTQPNGSDSIAENNEMLLKCIREGSNRYEWTYQHSDGSPIPTEVTMHRINIDGKKHAIAYSRDLREYYGEREKEKVLQGKIQAMMEQLNEHVEEQAASVATSSSAIEEMITNIQSVTDTLSKNADSVKELDEASVAGHASLSEVVSDIQGIARESESILEINSVMQNIASQTNLLSMNAAIEAAHAGESGRGFAVVADEIRKLAESSSRQSKTIGGVLKNIKGSIDKITKSTDTVLRKFNAIGDGVKAVAKQEVTILGTMEEQGQGSKQIMQAIGNVNEVTHKVKEAARRMVETSKETTRKANGL